MDTPGLRGSEERDVAIFRLLETVLAEGLIERFAGKLPSSGRVAFNPKRLENGVTCSIMMRLYALMMKLRPGRFRGI